MIARNEGEFELFQRMDAERRRHELQTNQKPRLMEETELPDWLLREEDDVITFPFYTLT